MANQENLPIKVIRKNKIQKMSRSSMNYAYLAALFLIAVSVQADDKEVIKKDALGLTIPNPLSSKPFFETNNQNGRYVSIHIPVLFEWIFHHHNGMDFKFEMTLLSGGFHFLWDRVKLEDGKRHGPIQLSLVGFPLYDNHEQPYA